MSISNCGHDENKRYSGGKAGDQTGTEYQIRSWYNRPWKCVLRHPNADVGKILAKIAKAAAKNEKIGYDQSQRTTYYTQLKAAGWKPEKIKTNCEADCSSSTAANVIAAGHQMGLKKLQNVNPNCTTSNLRAALKAAGFEVLTHSRYLTGDDYLIPGDVLLNDGHHVAINLTQGSKAGTIKNASGAKDTVPALASAPPNLRKGSSGTQVKNLQKDLNHVMKSGLSVDGEFGTKTENALKIFQKKYNLVVDGIYGEKSKLQMKKLLK
ncbi:MAG: peptidoglycan-binding protein [Eubacterium sp.]|nr:peptidoglycan-binding protein [Eubacterium sp.]